MSKRGQPAAPTLDRYMRDSYQVIRAVYDNIHAIQSVASHLTPVEDLVEFQQEVTHLYAHLALLVEASQIIVRITDAGYDMMTAKDVKAQRNLLQLGSAALRPESYFATAEDFNNLRNAFQLLSDRVAAIESLLDTFATKDELDQLRSEFNDRVQDLEDRVGFIIGDELEVIIGDETFTGLAKALEYLYARVIEVEGGLISQAGKIIEIESSISNLDGSISGLATAYNELSTEVRFIDGNMSTLSQQVTHLTGSVTNLDYDVAGLGDAFSLLNTTVVQQGENILAQSQRTDSLSAQVTNMADEVSGYSNAINNLVSRAEILEGSVDVLASQQTQLGVRITDAETGLVSQAEAHENLEIRVTQNEEGTTILGEDVTRLKGAIHSPGNIFPNAAFETSTFGWQIFSKGNGWTTAQMVHNMDVESALPPGLNALGIQVNGVPSGNLGVRSPRFPVEELKNYIISAYLIAENCELTLEWRTFDGSNNPLDFGVVGVAGNAPGIAKIADLERVFAKVPINTDSVQMELQLWVTDAHTASPRAWLTRPMVEEVNAMQEEPSPWVPSSAGIDLMYAEATQGIRIDIQDLEDSQSALSEAFANLEAAIEDFDSEAFQQLTAQVQQNKDDILTTSQSLTSLASRTGSLYEWRAVIHETGASNQSQLFPASSDTAAATLGSGMNLLRFNTDGTLQSAVNYPTTATQGRTNFVNAMNALNQGDFFVLAGVPNMGTRTQEVIDAVERNGGFRFKDLLPSRPYLLLGGGNIGKGAGVEVIAGSGQGIDHFFSLVRGVPKGLHESYAFATAYSDMETQVQQNASGLTALSQDVTALESEIEDKVSSSAFNTLSTQVSDIDGEVTGLSSWQQTLSARIPSGSGLLATQASVNDVASTAASATAAVANRTSTIEARMPSGTGELATADNAATKAELTSAQNALAAADVAEANARNALAVQLRGGYNGTNPASLTQGLIYNERQARLTAEGAIASTVSAMQLDLDGKASASDLAATQLTVSQQGAMLTAHGQQLSGLTASVGGAEASINELREVSARAMAGNALINPGFETSDGWGVSSDGSGGLPSGVSYYPSVSANSGDQVLRINGGAGARQVHSQVLFPVETGRRLVMGFRYRRVSATIVGNLRIAVREYDAAGQQVNFRVIGGVAETWSTAYQIHSAHYEAPRGVAFVRMCIQGRNTSGDVFVDDAFLEPVGESLADVLARYSLAVTAGGDVAGMQLLAGGGTSAIRFLADSFSVVHPGGGARTEFKDGNWTVRDSNGTLRVALGINLPSS